MQQYSLSRRGFLAGLATAKLFRADTQDIVARLGSFGDTPTLRFCVAGSQTLAPIYADGFRKMEHANPFAVSATGGSHDLYLDPKITYRCVIEDGTGKIVDEIEPYPNLLSKVVLGDTSLPRPVVLRTILLDSQVSRLLEGAGSGDRAQAAVTEETRKLQAIIDRGRSFTVPEPAVTYVVNTLRLGLGQTIEGSGQFSGDSASYGGKFQFTGNGVDPVFRIGDGSGAVRHISLLDLSVTNDGADCIVIDNAPNIILQRLRARSSTGGNAINARMSYRAVIRDCWLSGATNAIKALDNMNGLTVENVTCSGGGRGRAMLVGQSQAVRLVSNIIESSLDGIHVASTRQPGDGNCNGVLIAVNYFEQCRTPLILGRQFTVLGLECVSNYIGNSSSAVISAREASIQFGRINGGLIADNAIYPLAGIEDVFWIWLEVASGGFDKLAVTRNCISGVPGRIYRFKGAFADNASVKATVGGVCNFGFMGNADPLGTNHVAEYVSPLINSSFTTGPFAWLTDARKSMGGKIKSVDIIDHDGGADERVALAIGRSTAITENVNLADMNSLAFSNGRAAVPLVADSIFDGADSVYRVATAPGAVAKFRLRIRYRAN